MTYDFAYPEKVMYLTDVVSYLEVDIGASQSVLSNNNIIILPLTCYCFLLILTFSFLCCKILMVHNCKTLYELCHEKQLKTPNICLKI
jgi:hypothetical protein